MDIRLFRFFGQMDIRLFYFEVAKYTNGWDVYSIKPSIHQVRRFNRSYHVRLDEYCFCRFRKIIFDSYSKTRKNTQSWIDLFWFRFVLVLSISTTWSLSLLHLYMLRYLSDNGGYSGQNFLFFHSPKKWKSLFLPCFSCHFYRKNFSREFSFRNKFARELFKYQNLYIKGF